MNMRTLFDTAAPISSLKLWHGRPLIVDSFAGGGGASTGIEMALGRSPDIAINHNPAALALHAANHPDTLHLSENVYKVDPLDHMRGSHIGLMHFSPDCFPAGTMILTDRGYRPIETIQEGDHVLTHAGRYRRVYGTMRAVKAVRRIDVQGVPTITVSDEHPFYARAMHNVWDNANRRYQRTLAQAEWVRAKDLRVGSAPMNAAGGDRHFCATPCFFEPVAIPEVGGRGIAVDERLMWLAGRYVGDGWSRLGDGRAELVITCGKLEADGLAEKLAIWPRSGERAAMSELAWHRRDTKTAHQFSTSHRGLVEWLRDQFGHGGAEKSFPAWALSAPKALRLALLAGYVSADGSKLFTGANHITETVTISKALALSTKALAESLGFTATISYPRKNTTVIEGRTVNAKPTYMVRWREAPVRSQTVRDDLHNWARVQSVGTPGDIVEVFNISVEEDETYIADGIVVHNCKHFSKAKGGKPVERNIRDLAWIIPGWIERIQKSGGKVDVVTMENVEEWKDWGPLIETARGLMPCPDRRGKTFEAWCKAIKKLGGKIEWRELRACDYGAPTIRKRLFVVIRFDGKPIEWPEPTHGDPKSADVIAGRKQPWRCAAEIIDWSLPCPSIFDTKAEVWEKHGLRAVRPLADNTMARVARGMKRYVLDAERPFLVNLTHGGREEDIAYPMRTITGARRGEKAVIAPHVMTMRNAQKPFNGADEPLHTITAGGAGMTVVAPVITYAQQGGGVRSVEDPHHTITASDKDQNSIIVPTLIQTGYGEREGQAPRALDIQQPLGTVVAGGVKHAVVVPTIVGCGGRAGQSRPRGGDEPVATLTTKADGCVATAFIAQQNNDSRRIGGVNPGRAADEPLSTVTATGAQQAPVTAFIARQFGTSTGHGVDEPLGTTTAGGNKSQFVASYLSAYYGVDQDTPMDEPVHTVTTKPRFGHVETTIEVPPFRPEQEARARQVADLMRSYGFWDDREFVTLEIGGLTFVIVDIGMRMLTPRELFNAQGFPPDYVIEGVWQGEGASRHFVSFPKDVQVSCCGNSVSPYPYAAIVAANCNELAVAREAAE